MVNTEGNDTHQIDFSPKKTVFLKQFLFGIVVGCLTLDIIGFIQAYFVFGVIRWEMVVFFFLPFLVILAFRSLQISLIFELPLIIALFICHTKKKNWNARKIVSIYSFIIVLAILPVLLIHFLGIPQIPVLTEFLASVISYYEHYTYARFVTAAQYLITYSLIVKWFISWYYMLVLVMQPRSNQINVRNAKKLWFTWLFILALLLFVNPAYLFMTFR